MFDLLATVLLFSSVTADYVNIKNPNLFCESDLCQNTVTIIASQVSSQDALLKYLPQSLGLCLFCNSSLLPQSYDQIIGGDTFSSTDMKLHFGEPVNVPREICSQPLSGKQQVEFLKQLIHSKYQHHWLVDEFPVAWCYQTLTGNEYCIPYFPIGCYVNKDGRADDECYFISGTDYEPSTYYLYNHFSFKVYYEPYLNPKASKDKIVSNGHMGYIVKVTITPKSRRLSREGLSTYKALKLPVREETYNLEIIDFTYEVTWVETNQQWSRRWVLFEEQNLLPLSISVWNSFMLTLACLLGAFLPLVLRTHPRFFKMQLRLKRLHDRWTRNKICIALGMHIENQDAWKLMKNDALRRPVAASWLSALCGNSAQIFCASVSILVANCAGLLVPANPGVLETCIMWSYAISGIVSGFVIRHVLYYVLTENRKNALSWSPVLFAYLKSWLITWFFAAAFLGLRYESHRLEGSDEVFNAKVFTKILGVTVALPVVGTLLGGFLSRCWTSANLHLHILPDIKIKVTEVPSAMPRQPWYMCGIFQLLLGIIPFGAIHIPLLFLRNFLWNGHYVQAGGRYAAAFIMACLGSVFMTCYFTFFLLLKQNHRWWYKSLLVGIGWGLYFFTYMVYFYLNNIDDKGMGVAMIHLGYCLLIATAMAILLGPMCLIGSFLFVHRIYYYLQLEEDRITAEADAQDAAETTYCSDRKAWETLENSCDSEAMETLESDGWDVLNDCKPLFEKGKILLPRTGDLTNPTWHSGNRHN